MLFSLTLIVVGVYALLYVLISIPSFQNHLKNVITKELTALLGSKVEIEELTIYPFNEVSVNGLVVYDPEGEKCLEVEKIGAGIRLWKLLTEKRIELNYGEIIGLDGKIVQKEEGGPLNIQFLIDALSSKDKNKEKKPFDLALRNVVLRKSSVSFSRPWLGKGKILGTLNLADINITRLNADLAFPKISDKDIECDLCRMSFEIPGVTEVEKIGLTGKYNPDGILVNDLTVELPESRIFIPEVSLPLEEGKSPLELLKRGNHKLEITESYLTPSDFSFLFSPLTSLNNRLDLNLDVEGNLEEIEIKEFNLGSLDFDGISLKGEFLNILGGSPKADVTELEFKILSQTINKILPQIEMPEKLKYAFGNTGDINVEGQIEGTLSPIVLQVDISAKAEVLGVEISGNAHEKNKGNLDFEMEAIIDHLFVNDLLPEIPINDINANISAIGNVSGKDPNGKLRLVIDDFVLKGQHYEGLSLDIDKTGEEIQGNLYMDNAMGLMEAGLSGNLSKENQNVTLDLVTSNLNLSEIVDMKSYKDFLISGDVKLSAQGHDINDLTGSLSLSDFKFFSNEDERKLDLDKMELRASFVEGYRNFSISGDWIEGNLEGKFRFKDVVSCLQNMAYNVLPGFLNAPKPAEDLADSEMEFEFTIPVNNNLPEFFKLPVRLLVPINLKGELSGQNNKASLSIDVPFLQQGKDKLIEGTKLIADLDGTSGELNALIQTTFPVKIGELALDVNLYAHNNQATTDLKWINTVNPNFKGTLSIDTDLMRNELSHKPEFKVFFKPSLLSMGTARWNLEPATLAYSGDQITIDHLKLWHEGQFVEINGIASPNYYDVVTVSLADIDVDYIFDMLSINYVTFGGTATGEIAGHQLLSGDPIAETETLRITDFSYNGAKIGVCDVTSRWNNEAKEVEIGADISQDGHLRVKGQGGIWVGRDSLAFHILADKVPVEFVQPFMSAFSSQVGGFATGDVNLYGTFHDIDMTGKIFADSVSVKLDYTNTIYHGSDSVLLTPGRIDIPHFTLYDKFGNSAVLTGELTHRYFHEPSFNFRVSDARNFLCYDTSSEINPDWYGILYGTGSALVRGVPGLVDIAADMSVGGSSTFTFVLNDRQYAQDYQFLTFSDKRKEALKALERTTEDFKAQFKKKVSQQNGSPSKFGIDIRASVTPQVLFTLIMDPGAGDKITARGRGAIQVKYESDNDEMQMYGKYEIDEGNYNFSLQDIILRDFKIKEGSYISFNGNPLSADLDISATYRVNTNLSDLDKSFSTDRDLNRTNVPVDAVLSVNGNMQTPDITFDIELPTLTQDVERKVKSIISTDDMMNRQIIYLLALNRFYTPEYMGASGNGGELTAVASSTISSQLTNILGQLTDKVTVAPSFRSDKGDFSDIEVDVALSSRLLNNRLLINGNFGYRDKATSSTTFVGDFDVEYLLSRNGNFRLKAYNHFNDQNYYLREALTTQGLGIVFRKDFDTLFPFLRKKKKEKEPVDSVPSESKPELENVN